MKHQLEMIPNSSPGEKSSSSSFPKLEAVEGKLSRQDQEDKLMHSVLEGGKNALEEGKMLQDAFNQGVGAFVPDLMFEQFVSHYKLAKQLYGETIIRAVSGYSPEYVEKNVKIPEFQRELKQNMKQKIKELRKRTLLDEQGFITEKGIELASLSLYIEEIDYLQATGLLGERISDKEAHYGSVFNVRDYRKGDRYRDIATRKSVKKAIRRGHKELAFSDLKANTRRSKGKSYVIYALDASGSMKGKKISVCKKAGVALAYKAVQEHDEVGLIVFGKEVSISLAPTTDFNMLLETITTIKASQETDFAACLRNAIALFPETTATKHVLLLTDAMPTVGEDPEQATLSAVEEVVSSGITLSLIGIGLDEKGKLLAEKMTTLGGGKFYSVEDLDNGDTVDRIVLMDYYGL